MSAHTEWDTIEAWLAREGVSPDERQRIAERFVRLDAYLKRLDISDAGHLTAVWAFPTWGVPLRELSHTQDERPMTDTLDRLVMSTLAARTKLDELSSEHDRPRT